MSSPTTERLEAKPIVVALAGAPNAGKSAIFNSLTGARQRVANYPGVTVEKKEGRASHKGRSFIFIDLPGTYSLSSHSEDEVVARDFIVHEKPDLIAHVVDSTNLDRNLYLFTDLAELGAPIVLVLNMSDLIEKSAVEIDRGKLGAALGVPVVRSVGSRGEGIDELLDTLLKVYDGEIVSAPKRVEYGSLIEENVARIGALLSENGSRLNGYPRRWSALKLIENDSVATGRFSDLPLDEVDSSRALIERSIGVDVEAYLASARFAFISAASSGSTRRLGGFSAVSPRARITERIDKVVLNRFAGIPIFTVAMYAVFYLAFTCSEPLVVGLELFFGWLASVAGRIVPEGLFLSFLVDGLIGGVGGVMSFFPLILLVFFGVSLLEDTGYMARAVFVVDRALSGFGLHGKSFLPMMLSTSGCAVPGIMAARALENGPTRLVTMMVTPFMICSAKLPIFILFIAAFFPPEHGPNMLMLMFGVSITLALCSAAALKRFVALGPAASFVMDLPLYQVPTMRGTIVKMIERALLYLRKVGSIVVVLSIIIWAAFTFPRYEAPSDLTAERVASLRIENSIAGMVGKLIEPIVAPIGLDWRTGVALLSGIAAKEVVVSTLGSIYSLGEVDPENAIGLRAALRADSAWSPLKAIAFLIFCMVYIPCIATMTIFHRESGEGRWTLFLFGWTTLMAWLMSFALYQGGRALGF